LYFLFCFLGVFPANLFGAMLFLVLPHGFRVFSF
jgi:hypothetical protein